MKNKILFTAGLPISILAVFTAFSVSKDQEQAQALCSAIEVQPSSYWGAENSGDDLIGTDEGTLNGVTYVTGKVGSAWDLDGGSDYIAFPNDFIFHNGIATDATMEFWVNIDVGGGESIFWTRTGNTDSNRFNIGANSTNIFIDYREPNGTLHALGNWSGLTEDTWYHLALVRTVDDPVAGQHTYTTYVNGANNGATVDTSPNLPTETGWEIGGRTGLEFNGFVDELTFYNSALSATQVQAIYDADSDGKCFVQFCGDSTVHAGEECDDGNTAQGDGCSESCQYECVSEPSGLVSWYRAETNPFDFKGSNEGTLTNGAVANATGKVGNAFSFDGTDDYVTAPHNTNLQPTTISVAAWIRLDNTSGYTTVVEKSHGSIDNTGWALQANPSGFIEFYYGNGSGFTAPTSTTNVYDGQWHHVVGTLDGPSGTLRIYVDGSQEDTQAYTGTPTGNTRALNIGHWWNNGSPSRRVDGEVDEVMIFNTELTATEIANMYTADQEGMCAADCGVSGADAPATCTGADNVAPSFTVATDDSSTVGSPTVVGTPVTFTATATDPNADTYHLIVCADGDTVIPAVSGAPSCSSSQICVTSSAVASGVQASCQSANITATPTSVDWESFVCDVSADSKCSAVEFTNSPYYAGGNDAPELEAMQEDDGVMANGALFAAGINQQAFSFDGTDDYVVVSDDNSLDFIGDVTMMAWINVNDTNDQEMLSKYHQANDTGYVFMITGNKVNLHWGDGGGGWAASGIFSSTTTPTTGVWQHVAVVKSGTSLTYYLNGVADGSHTANTATIATNTEDMWIGGDNYVADGVTNPFDGMMDDLQLYSRALSAAEIEAIYEARSGGICEQTTGCTGLPANTVMWLDAEGDLDDNAGTASPSAVGNAAATGEAKVGSNSFTFDGDGDAIEVAYDPSGFDEITLMAWVKPDSSDLDAGVITTYKTNQAPSRGMLIRANGNADGRPDGGNYGSTGCPNGTADQWALVAATFDSSGAMRGYHNGSECGTAVTGFGSWNSGDEIHIGQKFIHTDVSEDDFLGEIDEVMVFDRALTATEILAIYNADANHVCEIQCPIDNALVAHYTGDRDAYDNKHFNDGALTNGATITTSNGGKIDEAFDFSGNSEAHVDLSANVDSLNESTPVTLSFWIKDSSDDCRIAYSLGKGSTNDNKFNIFTGNCLASLGSTDIFSIDYADSTSGVSYQVGYVNATRTVLFDGNWHHIGVVVYGNTTLPALYLDGSLVATTVGNAGSSYGYGGVTDPDFSAIGIRKASGSLQFGADGQIDELQIYRRALSAQEVSNLYTAQNAGSHGGTCYESCLEEPANLVSHWQGDFDAKDSKGSNNGDAVSGTIEPGDTMIFRATLSDVDLSEDTETMVNLAVCPDGSTYNSGNLLEPCGNGVTPICTATNQRPGTVICNDETNLTPIPTAHNASLPYEVFAWDQDEDVATYTATSAQTYSVEDVSPVINSFNLNSPITLLADNTAAYNFTAAVSDNNGDGDIDAASASGAFYDEGAGQTNACDDNTGTNANAQQECYRDTSCTVSEVSGGNTDANVTVQCDFNLQYNANASSSWEAYISVADDGANTTTGDSDTVSTLLATVDSLTAIDVRNASDVTNVDIAYGSLAPGGNTTTLNQDVYIANVGNTLFDTNLSGTDMCNNWATAYTSCNGATIGVTNQEFSLSATGVNYGSGTDLATSTQCLNTSDGSGTTAAVRTIVTTDTNVRVRFGIGLPAGTATGDFSGQNTFATAATTTCS